MKNKTTLTVLLLVLPLMTVFVTSNPAGVTVFDGKTVQTMSWLQTVPESPLGWCATVAALMNYFLFALAVVYALVKKNGCLKGIFLIALAAACIAALPIVIQSEIKIVPNAMGIILLGLECIISRQLQKKTTEEKKNEPQGKRLERH